MGGDEFGLRREYALREALEKSVLTGIAVVDAQGRQSYVNPAFCRMVEYSPEELIGKSAPFVYWPPEEIGRIQSAFEQTLRGQAPPSGFTLRFQRRSGACFDALVMISPVEIGGEPASWLASVTDITERQELHERIRESEQRFRQIVETASEGIWIVDPEGITTFVNSRMCEMVGYEPAELVGRCCFDIIHPEDRHRGAAAFEGRKQGDRGGREYRIFRKDGEIIWIHYSAAPLRDAAGRLTGILGMCTDVTQRRYSEARYQALFATLDDGVLIVNDEGVYVDANPSYCAMLKTTREQLIGSAFAPYIPKERLADAEAAFRHLVATGRYEGEFPLLASDGTLIELEWRSVGNFVPGYHCCIARDVRERKRFEQQMQQTQKLESLGVMAGGIAHDFNNLLVGILGNASLALEESREASIKPMLQDVVTASERAAGLVRQMLTYAGKGRDHAAPTDAGGLIRETVTLLKASIPKTAALHVLIADGLPWVESDPAQLQQVIMNLVINAAEAIPDGRAGLVTVSASARRLDAEDRARSVIPVELTGVECVEIRVTDNGSGMPPEIQRKIFDPFFTTKFMGRGLGLSAVLGIVRSHGGTLTLESEPGRGTTFRVLLPAVRVEPSPAAASSQTAAAPIPGSVLVVDDEETVRAAARRALEHHGYTVWTAESGGEALELLSAHPEISAVVLDLAMPVMTGDQLAPLLLARRPALPIILSSGYSESEAVRRFGAIELAGFLEKPYSARAVAEKVTAAIRSAAGRAATP
ncbi:MAG TPA: PAS domain S-box protein [Bryobacteraceae bacterium]|nr:PAS domain S-box protein [Bryobacteraceae bacterium]